MRERLAVLAVADEAEAGGRRDAARDAAHAAAPAPKREVQGHALRRTEQSRRRDVRFRFHEHVKAINRGRDGRNVKRGQVDLDDRIASYLP
jgi:hypothetical protein